MSLVEAEYNSEETSDLVTKSLVGSVGVGQVSPVDFVAAVAEVDGEDLVDVAGEHEDIVQQVLLDHSHVGAVVGGPVEGGVGKEVDVAGLLENVGELEEGGHGCEETADVSGAPKLFKVEDHLKSVFI